MSRTFFYLNSKQHFCNKKAHKLIAFYTPTHTRYLLSFNTINLLDLAPLNLKNINILILLVHNYSTGIVHNTLREIIICERQLSVDILRTTYRYLQQRSVVHFLVSI